MKYAISAFLLLNACFMQMHCMKSDDQKQLLDSHSTSTNASYQTSCNNNSLTPTAPPAYNQNSYNNVDVAHIAAFNNQSQSNRVAGAPLPADTFDERTGETYAQFWLRLHVPRRIQQLTKEAQISYVRSTVICVMCDELWCRFSCDGSIGCMLCCCCCDDDRV